MARLALARRTLMRFHWETSWIDQAGVVQQGALGRQFERPLTGPIKTDRVKKIEKILFRAMMLSLSPYSLSNRVSLAKCQKTKRTQEPRKRWVFSAKASRVDCTDGRSEELSTVDVVQRRDESSLTVGER